MRTSRADPHRPKLFRDMIGRWVRLRRRIETTKGHFDRGILMVVTGTWRGLLHLQLERYSYSVRQVNPDSVKFLPKEQDDGSR